ncbi:NADH dehydrogenase [ubiquinone] 1 alpha subcomplex subunit 7 [Melipona quadrifasciata]|uniref:NADH dehydrogenase [ubiquinone] 1 alpha subcomplex subunit 7 n=1 Tax=Melipona quadrifasciata TaxID=166423 RepID=A0A0M9ADL9_9HYME|nr:NADH dehydrogenase [ubiquinone] 1 alpha subcomplex subunit 7 [Melipona quadrifasciata]
MKAFRTTTLLEAIRNILRGKPHIDGLRYADKISARTQPQPNVPFGPYHKTSKVYYYTRDARRSVEPPSVIYAANQLKAGKVDLSRINLNPFKKQLSDK